MVHSFNNAACALASITRKNTIPDKRRFFMKKIKEVYKDFYTVDDAIDMDFDTVKNLQETYSKTPFTARPPVRSR
jgi:hypothetical protein